MQLASIKMILGQFCHPSINNMSIKENTFFVANTLFLLQSMINIITLTDINYHISYCVVTTHILRVFCVLL